MAVVVVVVVMGANHLGSQSTSSFPLYCLILLFPFPSFPLCGEHSLLLTWQLQKFHIYLLEFISLPHTVWSWPNGGRVSWELVRNRISIPAPYLLNQNLLFKQAPHIPTLKVEQCCSKAQL